MWFGATVCRECINRKIAGENIHWLEYVWKKYMAPRVAISAGAAALRSLILGSSEGGIELRLCEKGFEQDAIDCVQAVASITSSFTTGMGCVSFLSWICAGQPVESC
jgi:hypothetical protein